MINSETGLPDLSELGEGLYWQVTQQATNRFNINISRDRTEPALQGPPRRIDNPNYRWWNWEPKKIDVEDSPTTSTISEVLHYRRIQHLRTFEELGEYTKRSMHKYWISLNKSYDVPDAEKLFNNEGFMERYMFNVYEAQDLLYDRELTDALVLESATALLERASEQLRRAKRESEREKNNESYVGKYPPKKLGGSIV